MEDSSAGPFSGESLLTVETSLQSAPLTGPWTGSDSEPDAFVCPISFELMRDPVMCADGHTYERDAIERWLQALAWGWMRMRARVLACVLSAGGAQSNKTSPKTNEKLPSSALVPNHNLRAAIQEWREGKLSSVRFCY